MQKKGGFSHGSKQRCRTFMMIEHLVEASAKTLACNCGAVAPEQKFTIC